MNFLTHCVRFYGTHLSHPGHWRVAERIIQAFGLTPNEETVIQAQGLIWHINPSDRVQRDVFWYGEKDRWDLHHLFRLLHQRKGPVILDVGANFGYYSILLADRFGEGTAVHAFEPAETTAARLNSNVESNRLSGAIQTHRVALSDVTGTGSLRHVGDDSGQNCLGSGGDDGERIEVMRLDDWVKTQPAISRIDLIKIDVEGFEPRFFTGAQQTIAHFRPILLVEINPNALERSGSSAGLLMQQIRSLGYDLFVAARKQLVALDSAPASGEFVNAFCVPIRGGVQS